MARPSFFVDNHKTTRLMEAPNNVEDVQVPAHESRHDFTVTDVQQSETPFVLFVLEARIDNGPMLGKRLTQKFRFHEPSEANEFVKAVGTPDWAKKGPAEFLTWIESQVYTARFSARVDVTKELYDADNDVWLTADTLPEEECKYRFRYALKAFDNARSERKLHLASNFYQRRKRLERRKQTNQEE